MPRVNIYLSDLDAKILAALQREGVGVSKLMQEAIRQEAERQGYVWVLERTVRYPAEVRKMDNKSPTVLEV